MPPTRPTVVLVHDGCSDATSWFGVIAETARVGRDPAGKAASGRRGRSR
ncbi:hypothetical protein KAURM247S_00820 [Kitasatospora aureofaciens]